MKQFRETLLIKVSVASLTEAPNRVTLKEMILTGKKVGLALLLGSRILDLLGLF